MQTVAPLRLERFIPMRDVRKLIWRYLNPCDREMVKYAQNIMHDVRPDVLSFLIITPIWHGHIELFRWMHALPTTLPVNFEEDVMTCIANGHTDMFYWFLNQNLCTLKEQHVRAAAHAGQLELLQWILSLHPEWLRKDKAGNSVIGGHIHVLEWVYNTYPSSFDLKSVLYDAMYSDAQEEVCDWVCSKGYVVSKSILKAAAEGDCLKFLKWAVSKNIVLPQSIINDVLDADTFEFLYDYGIQLNWMDVLDGREYNLRLFQLAMQHGVVLTPEICESLAYDGYLEILQWIYTSLDK